MRNISFTPAAFKDYIDWSECNPDVFSKINDLIREIQRDPFKGKGKPEPLKNQFRNCWSRRINLEHRLVYTIDNTSIIVIGCHGHYE